MIKQLFNKIDVAAGIICRHNLILASERPEGSAMAGYWEFPGGKRENNETIEEALCRELAEELGINVLEFNLLETISHPYPQLNLISTVYFYQVTNFEGEPCPNEGQNLRWIEISKLREFEFLPADAQVIDLLAHVK